MNAQQLIKKLIIEKGIEFGDAPCVELTPSNIDEVFDIRSDNWGLQDATNEVRCSGVETNLDAPYSRHYECDFVARKVGDVWIGWPYWYGGGKYGEPEAVDWIEYAVFLDCEEKEIMTVQRTFSKPQDAA